MYKLIFTTLISTMLATGCGGSSSKPQLEQPSIVEPALSEPALTVEIPVAGNSWILGKVNESDSLISAQGITNWTNTDDELVTYVYVSRLGAMNIGVKGKVLSGKSSIEVSLNNQQQLVELSNTSEEVVFAGEFTVEETGYQQVIIRGISSSSGTFPQLSHLMIGGAAAEGDNYYIQNDFYWGRRGPSVHLSYTKPNPGENNEWFYSEIEVPKGSDTLGSYFMTNGFGEGYMGIQVNSELERRVLFSVWSPFHTDDASLIPNEDKIVLLGKGAGVSTGEFGNEGAGGQSYYIYNWQAATTYKLLVNIKPSEEAGNTDYTGYFFLPETNKWKLIASFRRPKTTTYVSNQHSFLENFNTGAGQFERKGLYKNQWLYSESGQWYPLTEAIFSYDETAQRQDRLDYQAGVENGVFFLKNTGFFSENTPKYTKFEVKPSAQPVIDFNALPPR